MIARRPGTAAAILSSGASLSPSSTSPPAAAVSATYPRNPAHIHVVSPDATSASDASTIPGASHAATQGRRGKRRAPATRGGASSGDPLHVILAADIDDDIDAKRKKKKSAWRFGKLCCLQILRRSASRFCVPGSPREGKGGSPVAHSTTQTIGRNSVSTALFVFSMAVATTLWIATGHSRWSALFLKGLRGRRIESVFRANEVLLQRPAGERRGLRPSTVFLPPGSSESYGGRREPHYGGLNFLMLEEEGEARRIYHDWTLGEGKRDRPRPTDDTNDYYYSLDDDDMRNTYRGWSDDTLHKKKRCRRTSWHRNVPVNCNAFHELDVRTAAQHRGFRHVGEGSYKHVFILNTTWTSGVPEVLVFKNFGVAAKFDTKNYERMRKDALVSERVGPHRLLVDIYGYCGLAQLDEVMPHGGLENVALPSHARRQYRVKLNDTDRLDPRNSLLPSEKLALALDMFEAVALLHNYRGGVIVHDDIQLLQFLLTPDRKHVKLNDFNRMEVMLWDDNDQAYCRYRNGEGQGNWRSPEEYQDLPLDEKIDVFSLGNNLFSILTGLSPFYSASGFQEVQRLVAQGMKPYLDPRWKERSFAERTIVELIHRCHAYDPKDRIDVGAAVKFLRDAIRTNKLHHSHEDKLV